MPSPINGTDPDGPLRLAYLSYRSKPTVGGQGIYTRHLTKAMVDLGHTVEVFSGQPYPVLDVRMVKGIYLEPAAIAETEPGPIADAYVRQTRRLFEGGARVALATHDDVMAPRLFADIAELGVTKQRYELQVLMGVRRWLWKQWLDAGHPIRVYVPYGPEWRPYSLRRLKKNPKLLTQFAKGIFGG